MLNILRVSGFYDTGIFFIGKYKENNVYYIEVNDPDDISAGYIIKKLLIQNTIVNTIEPLELTYPAEVFSRQLCNGVLYYVSFSYEKMFLHVHSVNCGDIHISQITLSLKDIIGKSTLYRTEINGIDDRYCLVGISISETFETTNMILIDFAEKMYYNISPDFGIDTLYRIETIMKLMNDKNNPQKEEIAIITGGFHYKEKYEIWNNSDNKINLDYKLMEHVIVLDKLNFIRMLKSGLPLEVKNIQILESCSLDKSIISYENNLTKMNYTLVDFEKNTTKRIEYDTLSGKQTLFEYNNILSSPVLMDKKLYSIETLDNKRYAILDLQTNQFIFILSLGEKILSVDNHIILTYKWLDEVNQQMVYMYDLREELIEQKFLGIGFAHYDGKNVTIFN